MIPAQVRIGSMVYEVVETDAPILLDGRECRGKIDYNAGKIYLRSSGEEFSDSSVEQTLQHEILHGILEERGIEDMVDPEFLEDFVDQMSRGLLDVEYIKEASKK